MPELLTLGIGVMMHRLRQANAALAKAVATAITAPEKPGPVSSSATIAVDMGSAAISGNRALVTATGDLDGKSALTPAQTNWRFHRSARRQMMTTRPPPDLNLADDNATDPDVDMEMDLDTGTSSQRHHQAAPPPPASHATPTRGPWFAIPPSPYVEVEFPGLIANPQRALDMLGGVRGIARSLAPLPGAPTPPPVSTGPAAGHRVPLELRWADDNDAFVHPVFGEVLPTCNLVVQVVRRRRVRRRRRYQPDEEEETEPGPWTYAAQVRGVIVETGRFRGMADYQWWNDPADPIAVLRREMASMNLESLRSFHMDVPDETDLSDLRQFAPPMMSAIEVPLHYDYKQSSAVVKLPVTNADGTQGLRLINRSKSARIPTVSVSATDATPRAADPGIEAFASTVPAPFRAEVARQFASRPIWLRTALHAEMQATGPWTASADAGAPVVPASTTLQWLKKVLPSVAYYIQSGPWKMTWVRFAYDPRADLGARVWQSLDTRNHFKTTWLRAKRRELGSRATAAAGTAAASSQGVTSPTTPVSALSSTAGESPTTTTHNRSPHIFDGVTVNNATSLFQLCDLHDPILREL
ncbi:RNA polymerase III transcription factor IIIC subunit-domain-containing protein, partial [Blastocladiella britannica]